MTEGWPWVKAGKSERQRLGRVDIATVAVNLLTVILFKHITLDSEKISRCSKRSGRDSTCVCACVCMCLDWGVVQSRVGAKNKPY